MLKKLLFSFTLFAASISYSFSQDYQLLEWDVIHFGYAIPGGDGVSGGILLGTEPRVNIGNTFSASIRWELALFGSSDDFGGDIGASGSIALFGDYYISNNANKRFYAGLGIGNFGGASVTVTDPNGNEIENDGGSSIGIVPRVGYELGFIRLGLEYNLAFDEAVPNYLGIRLGLNVGGRLK